MKAYFVNRPRTIFDLNVPHLADCEHEYEIVRTISLSGLDYDNFIWDMLADRDFIEDNHALCSEGDTYRCLLVKAKDQKDGVLVVSDNICFVGLAAYYTP